MLTDGVTSGSHGVIFIQETKMLHLCIKGSSAGATRYFLYDKADFLLQLYLFLHVHENLLRYGLTPFQNHQTQGNRAAEIDALLKPIVLRRIAYSSSLRTGRIYQKSMTSSLRVKAACRIRFKETKSLLPRTIDRGADN